MLHSLIQSLLFHSFIHELFSRYLSCAKYSNVLRLQWYKRKSLLLLLEMRIIKKVGVQRVYLSVDVLATLPFKVAVPISLLTGHV